MTAAAKPGPSEKPLELSIIVPAYNEALRIRPTLEEYAAHFAARYDDRFEVVVVLNGCTDDTRSVVESVMEQAPQVRMLEFAEALGKGGAIRQGLGAAQGRILAFVDADNMVRAPETQRLIDALGASDVAIADRFGGRDLGGGQPPLRRLASRLLRLWVRLALRLPYRDTQCGAKAFRAEAWRTLEPLACETGWAFDLDVLANARRLGLSVAEVPVAWRHVAEGSKIQTWRAGPEVLLATLRIRRRQQQEAKAHRGA